MWETRHGFPRPHRLPGGHRRYSTRDVDLLRAVVRYREAGLSLDAAIARAIRAGSGPPRSIFAGLRRRQPELTAHVLEKRVMTAISNAIEDEYCAHAERATMFGAFQTERFYRSAEERWRELARTAEAAVVFADFGELRQEPLAPTEIPLEVDDPLAREWALVCDAPRYAACLAAWEVPGESGSDRDRRFEAVWSVDPRVVRDASRVAAGLVSGPAPDLGHTLASGLEDDPPVPGSEELAVLAALTSRMVAYVARETA
jgi:MerR family transcriptional regulator, light-induced transcriptional regulator